MLFSDRNRTLREITLIMTAPSPSIMPAKEDEWRKFSPMLLRDLCQCAACIHHSTRQKLFSTTDIPRDIRVQSIAPNPTSTDVVDILWDGDVPGYDAGHITSLDTQWLRDICKDGAIPGPFQGRPMQAAPWNAQTLSPREFEYDEYMRDDTVLYSATEQLQTHGLVFITNVPSSEKSVSAIAERIGPLKSTFYGDTWDGKSNLGPRAWMSLALHLGDFSSRACRSHAKSRNSSHRPIGYKRGVHLERPWFPF